MIKTKVKTMYNALKRKFNKLSMKHSFFKGCLKFIK